MNSGASCAGKNIKNSQAGPSEQKIGNSVKEEPNKLFNQFSQPNKGRAVSNDEGLEQKRLYKMESHRVIHQECMSYEEESEAPSEEDLAVNIEADIFANSCCLLTERKISTLGSIYTKEPKGMNLQHLESTVKN